MLFKTFFKRTRIKLFLSSQDEVGLDFLNDPDRTSKTNGWIYGCFEPVAVEIRQNTENQTFFISKGSSQAGKRYLQYLDGKSKFLNALNLMAFEEDFNHNKTKHLMYEEEIRRRFIMPLG